MPPAVAYSTGVYVLPTGVQGVVVRASGTESTMFVEPTPSTVAKIASRTCGLAARLHQIVAGLQGTCPRLSRRDAFRRTLAPFRRIRRATSWPSRHRLLP